MSFSFARMVHQYDGGLIASLQPAQEVEQRRHLGGCVLVDSMQAHERVEHEQQRTQCADRLFEALLVELDVEPDHGRDDDVDVECLQGDADGGSDAGEPLPYDAAGGDPTTALGKELDVIAAVVIGGGSPAGGSILGSLVGACLMTVLANGSTLLGIPNYVQEMLVGAIIIAAVAIDRFRHRSAR